MKPANNNDEKAEDREEICKREKCLSINELADMFGVNVWTIRLWADRFDILDPRRNEKDELMFTPADVERIGLISRLSKKQGVTLEDIRKYLEMSE